jgi:1,4-dihydroxy-2-naphthoate octaprenyltransferase
VGISTIATDKTEFKGMQYYKLLLASAYISTILLILFRVFSLFALISFVSINEALKIVKTFSVNVPLNSDQQTAQLALNFGVFLTLGELINIIYLLFV